MSHLAAIGLRAKGRPELGLLIDEVGALVRPEMSLPDLQLHLRWTDGTGASMRLH